LDGTSLYHHVIPRETFETLTGPKKSAEK
jgi:hypothetical protein